MTLDEQETSVSYTRSDEVVYIYSANPKHLRKLRADDRVTETKTATEADTEKVGDWGMFEVPASMFDPLTGFKRKARQLSDEQKLALTKRLRNARNTGTPAT